VSAAQRLRVGAPEGGVIDVLVWGLDLAPWSSRFELVRARPAELISGLGRGDLDLALAPAPLAASGALDVDIVPGLSVCTNGPSGLARRALRVPLSEVRTVESPEPGHAAEALCAVLFAESGRSIRLVHAGSGVTPDATLVTETDEDAGAAGESIDLGDAWTSLTGLPMVWWLWAARPGMVGRETYAVLHTARTRGKHARPDHVGARFRLGRQQVAGLIALIDAAARHGLVPSRRESGLKWVRLASHRPCTPPGRANT
jgi:hypothetical protein